MFEGCLLLSILNDSWSFQWGFTFQHPKLGRFMSAFQLPGDLDLQLEIITWTISKIFLSGLHADGSWNIQTSFVFFLLLVGIVYRDIRSGGLRRLVLNEMINMAFFNGQVFKVYEHFEQLLVMHKIGAPLRSFHPCTLSYIKQKKLVMHSRALGSQLNSIMRCKLHSTQWLVGSFACCCLVFVGVCGCVWYLISLHSLQTLSIWEMFFLKEKINHQIFFLDFWLVDWKL